MRHSLESIPFCLAIRPQDLPGAVRESQGSILRILHSMDVEIHVFWSKGLGVLVSDHGVNPVSEARGLPLGQTPHFGRVRIEHGRIDIDTGPPIRALPNVSTELGRIISNKCP